MSDSQYVMLDQRGVIAIEGDDARPFLQGLISNDINKVSPTRAIYAALLTPQGKCLFDFFIVQWGDRLLLDVEADRLPALVQRLSMYKLRAKLDIADVSGEVQVAAILGPAMPEALTLDGGPGAARELDDGLLFTDPRLPRLGARAMLPAGSAEASLQGLGLLAGTAGDYRRLRFAEGVPEGAAELGIDKSPLLELGFDELNGVDFEKGCFVGQELTARMKYRGLVRKRLLPVTFDGDTPAAGTPVLAGERDIGELRSAGPEGGFAVLRLDKLADSVERGDRLSVDRMPVTPVRPAWVNDEL